MTNETVGLELAPPDLADPLDSTFDVRPLDGRAAGGQEATPSTVGAKDAARTGLEPPPQGVPRPATPPVDTDGDAVYDRWWGSDWSCADFVVEWCGVYDDDDFSSLEMCCICQGLPTPVPSVPPTALPASQPTALPTP